MLIIKQALTSPVLVAAVLASTLIQAASSAAVSVSEVGLLGRQLAARQSDPFAEDRPLSEECTATCTTFAERGLNLGAVVADFGQVCTEPVFNSLVQCMACVPNFYNSIGGGDFVQASLDQCSANGFPLDIDLSALPDNSESDPEETTSSDGSDSPSQTTSGGSSSATSEPSPTAAPSSGNDTGAASTSRVVHGALPALGLLLFSASAVMW